MEEIFRIGHKKTSKAVFWQSKFIISEGSMKVL